LSASLHGTIVSYEYSCSRPQVQFEENMISLQILFSAVFATAEFSS